MTYEVSSTTLGGCQDLSGIDILKVPRSHMQEHKAGILLLYPPSRPPPLTLILVLSSRA